MIIFLVSLFILFVWWLCGSRLIRENEVGVVVRLGKPKRVINSGLRHILWPFDYLRIFSTELIELEFSPAQIITSKKLDDCKEEHGAANIQITPTLYFRWPTDETLLKTIKVIGDPQDEPAVSDLFEESVLDAIRSLGKDYNWREIVQDTKGFAETVKGRLLNENEDPLSQAQIPSEHMKLVLRNPKLPDALAEAITAPEVARLKAEAAVKTGEGEKKRLILLGEGEAGARKKIFAAIGDDDKNLLKEQLFTLRKMAEGTASTIFIPSSITEVLEKSFGGKFDPKNLSDQERESLKKLLKNI